MTKAELIEKIARSRDLPPDVTKKCIGQILDLAFDELGAYFVRARVTRSQCPRFTFPAFGTFTKKRRSERKGVNPRTLEPMTIDAAYTIDFRPGAELRQNLNLRGAPAGAAKGKRRAAAQLGLGPENVETTVDTRVDALVDTTVPRLVEPLEDEEDSVAIHRRRFTSRDDLDDLDGEFEGDSLAPENEALELPPAPMQRARVRGAAAAGRSGSRGS